VSSSLPSSSLVVLRPQLGGRIQKVKHVCIGRFACVGKSGPIPIAKPICGQQVLRVWSLSDNYTFFVVATPARRPNPRGKRGPQSRPRGLQDAPPPSGPDSYCKAHMFSAGSPGWRLSDNYLLFFCCDLGGRIQEVGEAPSRGQEASKTLPPPAGPIPIAKPTCFQQVLRFGSFSENSTFFFCCDPGSEAESKR